MSNSNQYGSLRLNPTEFLGLDFNKYKSQILKLAITSPADYYQLRSDLEENLQFNAINALYDTIFFALTKGTDKNGQPFSTVNMPCEPHYPQQKINDLTIGACEALDKMIKEVIEILLPGNYDDVMSSRLMDKGSAKLMGDL